VNGSAAVISAVAAALLALSFGFQVVFLAGAACYAGAWLTFLGLEGSSLWVSAAGQGHKPDLAQVVSFQLSLFELEFPQRLDSPTGPIGITNRPPSASCLTRGLGRWSGAAVTRIA